MLRYDPSNPMGYETLRTATDSRGVATLTLSRPEVRNAFDEMLVAELREALARFADDNSVRVLVLTGEGSSFSAGADLDWMRRSADWPAEKNLADAEAAASMLLSLDRLPKPVVARVNGPAMGGGAGLVACADVALAAESAYFAFPEVRLGIAPAVISPYVVRSVGERRARLLFLSGARFSARQAREYGLVHELAPDAELDQRVEAAVAELLRAAPGAASAAKALVRRVAGRPVDEALGQETAHRIAELRASEEGREGIAAFLKKRKPSWRPT